MQQADAANSSGSYGASPGKGGGFSGPPHVVMLHDPFEDLSEVTCGQEIIGSLLDLAQTEIEDHENGRYYTTGNPHPLKRLSHLLYAIDIVHRSEIEKVERAENNLLDLHVPSMLRRRA